MLESDFRFSTSGAPKMTPITTFSIIGCMVAHEVNAPQSSTMVWIQAVIVSVVWLISNGSLVAEIWSFQVLGWCSAQE